MRSAQNLLDQIISTIDDGLRVTFTQPHAKRPSPAIDYPADPIAEDTALQTKSAALMRVNHVGEVCAQALYQGQALTSRSPNIKLKMREAADEEIDHLNWCFHRIQELNGKPSLFNPIWYAGSLALGISAGLAGDKWSLGFLAETERQVVDHLNSHLEKLPQADSISRSIVQQMADDEAKHAQMANDEGAIELPTVVKQLMQMTAKIMTTISEKI